MKSHNRIISITGLGYIGLPMAVEFAKQGKVICFDTNKKRIEDLKSGYDRTDEIESSDITNTNINFTTDANDLKQADFHIVAVPTPVDKAKKPDLESLLMASSTIGGQLKKSDIVVFESTVYPGVTEEECIPILEEQSGLKAGKDFYVGYSPERINPGDKKHTFRTITKVISAQDADTLEIIAEVYESVVEAGVHRASSIKVAEAAKVIENTQRDLNISLINELAIIFKQMDIDTRDVLEAAGTKWNFLPFEPGLVGGHCIGVDPYYLTYQAERLGYSPQVILAGRRINDGMGKYVAAQLIKQMIKANLVDKNCIITILGFTFKENVPDIRNTRVLDIINELNDYGFNVQVHDPIADKNEAREVYGVELSDAENLLPAHALVLAVPHCDYMDGDWKLVTSKLIGGKGVVIDVRAKLDRERVPPGIVHWRL